MKTTNLIHAPNVCVQWHTADVQEYFHLADVRHHDMVVIDPPYRMSGTSTYPAKHGGGKAPSDSQWKEIFEFVLQLKTPQAPIILFEYAHNLPQIIAQFCAVQKDKRPFDIYKSYCVHFVPHPESPAVFQRPYFTHRSKRPACVVETAFVLYQDITERPNIGHPDANCTNVEYIFKRRPNKQRKQQWPGSKHIPSLYRVMLPFLRKTKPNKGFSVLDLYAGFGSTMRALAMQDFCHCIVQAVEINPHATTFFTPWHRIVLT